MNRYIFFILFTFIFFIEAELYSTVVNVSTQGDFDKLIKSKKITVAKFYAPWCGPCVASERPFEMISDSPDTTNAQFIEVNTDTLPELAKKYNV